MGLVLFEVKASDGKIRVPVETNGELQSLFKEADEKGIGYVKFFLNQVETNGE